MQGGGTALGAALRSVPDPVREVFDDESPGFSACQSMLNLVLNLFNLF